VDTIAQFLIFYLIIVNIYSKIFKNMHVGFRRNTRENPVKLYGDIIMDIKRSYICIQIWPVFKKSSY
jgi:hypothetical protein